MKAESAKKLYNTKYINRTNTALGEKAEAFAGLSVESIDLVVKARMGVRVTLFAACIA